jgi:hypothetical protein
MQSVRHVRHRFNILEIGGQYCVGHSGRQSLQEQALEQYAFHLTSGKECTEILQQL